MAQTFRIEDFATEGAQESFSLLEHATGSADMTVYDVSGFDKGEKSTDSAIDPKAMMLLLYREIARGPTEGPEYGLARNHVRSMNALYEVGIPQIFENQFKIENTFINERTQTEEDRSIGNGNITFSVKISNVRLSRPTTKLYQSGRDAPIMPAGARENASTYSCQIYADATITASATKNNGGSTVSQTATVTDFRIAAIPCAVGSKLCNTYGLTRKQLENLGEDPDDIGGYFIIRGMPWAIVCGENILNNEPHIHITRGHNKEVCRLNYLSKPGDAFENSYEVIIRLYENNAITLDVTTKKQSKTELPFFMLYRAMGMASDKQIVDSIVFGVDERDDLTKSIKEVVDRAYHAPVEKVYRDIIRETNAAKIVEHINFNLETAARINSARKDANAQQYMNRDITKIFDRYMFPHMGTDTSKRIEKLYFIGYLINKLILTSMGVLDPTDRDSYDIKCVLSAGPTLAKAVKTQYNIMFVQHIRKALTYAYKKESFSAVNPADVFKTAINGTDLESGLMQAITSGNKQLRIKNVREPIHNRVDSQLRTPKNPLYLVSVATLISTPSSSSASKSSVRADLLRRVHAGYVGFVDVLYSAETGDTVGTNKQAAVSASFTDFRPSFMLVEIISSDPDMTPANKLSPTEIARQKMATILVNGRRLGFCRSAVDFAVKYRKMRRLGRIERDTGITQRISTREVHFRLDVGRPKRPLIIVYNNYEEYVRSRTTPGEEKVAFRQWVEITREDLYALASNETSMRDLEERGVIEYITASEQSNCLLAMNINYVRENEANPLIRYTHCDIDQAIVSLLILSAPLGNNSEPNRTCYYGNHKKGAIGQAAGFMRSTGKGESFMPYIDNPIVSTFTDMLTTPTGQNAMVAVMVYGAFNQEDSLTVNQRSVELGFLQIFYSTIKSSKLEKDESFGAPDAVSAAGRRGVSYANLDKGFAKKGTYVKKGDAIIAKTITTAKKTAEFATQVDKTMWHTSEEPMFVHDVRPKLRDGDDQIFGRVRLMSNRYFLVGDKACLTSDHDILTTVGWIPVSGVTASHIVATRCPRGALVWARPSAVHHYPHHGDVYSVKSGAVNKMVTLDHRMLVASTHGVQLVSAEDRPDGTSLVFARMLPRFPSCEYLLGANGAAIPSDWQIPRGVLQALLIGISFGRVAANTIILPAEMRARVEPYAETCAESFRLTPLTVEYTEDSFAEGTIMLPHWIWRATPTQATALLRLVYGEAARPGLAIPAGPIFAGQIMCLSMIAGMGATYDGTNITLVSGRANVLAQETSIVHYAGSVHCVEVPGGVFYTRRGGCPVWTGNSSRTGNKGIVGSVWPATLMPYTAQGVVPDIIVNPHSIPTRMAINQIIECVAAKLAMKFGHTVDATMFTNFDVWSLIERMKEAGEPLGDLTVLYNPETGEKMEAILFGPTFYQRIAKFIDDENYANRTGPTNAITNQPVSGRANNGALKIGEMEKDVLVSHGSMSVFYRKFYVDSDGTTIHVCRRCSHRAIVNEKQGRYTCVRCVEYADICSVPSSYVANVLFSKLEGMNIDPRLDLAPYSFPAEHPL